MEETAPTEAEMAILRVLWRHGPQTVREVHEALGGEQRSRYTTTLKQLQVMTEKEFVTRDASQRSHVYAAHLNEHTTEQSLVKNFLQRVFGGSVEKMILHALDAGNLSKQELTEIQQTIRQWEKRP